MSKEKRKKTSIKAEKSVGEHAYNLQKKTGEQINPIELQQAIHKGNTEEDSFENQILICLERGQQMFEDDFFIVVLFKKERLIGNVVRQYFLPRISCPTPEWDQVVYHFKRKGEELKFLWVVPDKESCTNLPLYGALLPEDQQTLLQFAKDFNSGALDKLCAKLNGEKVA